MASLRLPLRLALLLLGVGMAAAGCTRAITSSERSYAYSVCYGEFQKYADVKLCRNYPSYISDGGMGYYSAKIQPSCTDGQGYWQCDLAVKNPCKGMAVSKGSIGTETSPKQCKKTFPSPGNTYSATKSFPTALKCPRGYRPATGSEIAVTITEYLWGFLTDEKRGALYIPASQYCNKIGFQLVDISNVQGCMGSSGKGLVAQSTSIRWVCAGSTTWRTLKIQVTAPQAVLVCPWYTTIKAV